MWKVTWNEGESNHDISKDLDMHTSARRLIIEQQIQRVRIKRAGCAAKRANHVLRQEYPDLCIVIRDIYYAKQKVPKGA